LSRHPTLQQGSARARSHTHTAPSRAKAKQYLVLVRVARDEHVHAQLPVQQCHRALVAPRDNLSVRVQGCAAACRREKLKKREEQHVNEGKEAARLPR